MTHSRGKGVKSERREKKIVIKKILNFKIKIIQTRKGFFMIIDVFKKIVNF